MFAKAKGTRLASARLFMDCRRDYVSVWTEVVLHSSLHLRHFSRIGQNYGLLSSAGSMVSWFHGSNGQ